MIVIDAESETDHFHLRIAATIPASTPLYLQDQLGARLSDRAIMLTEQLEEYLIEWDQE